MEHNYKTPLFLVPGFDVRQADEEQKAKYIQELEDLREALLFGDAIERTYVANRVAIALQEVPGNFYED